MLRKMYFHRLFDNPPVIEPLPEAKHGAQARAIASKAMVLLKNDNAILPLDPADEGLVAIIGPKGRRWRSREAAAHGSNRIMQ